MLFLGRHSEAVKDYDLAILMNPDYADAYAGRGISKINLGQYASAINDLESARKLKPDKSRDLIAYLDTLIELKPDYAEARCRKRNLEDQFTSIRRCHCGLRYRYRT